MFSTKVNYLFILQCRCVCDIICIKKQRKAPHYERDDILMLIAKITESDFFGGEPQYIDDDARYNTRGVMTDGEGNIAMMKIEDSKYYKLSGGSIEITETPDKAFLREVTEETGYPAELLGYLGWIEEHKFKRKFCMVSHCYVAKKVSDKCDTSMLERSQERLGYKIEWMPYDEAVSRLKALSEQCKEYQMSFVLKREQLILEKAKEYIVK